MGAVNRQQKYKWELQQLELQVMTFAINKTSVAN
jgi:hypothetical protein